MTFTLCGFTLTSQTRNVHPLRTLLVQFRRINDEFMNYDHFTWLNKVIHLETSHRLVRPETESRCTRLRQEQHFVWVLSRGFRFRSR